MPFTPPPSTGGGTASNLVVQDEGSTIGTATVMNFTGVGGTASFSNGTATFDVPGLIVYDEGTVMGTVTKLNFVGAGVVGTVTSGTAIATISGGTVAGPTVGTASATANTALTTDTIADVAGCAVSLAAGNWLIGGVCTFDTGAANYILAAITDNANAKVSEGRTTRSTASPTSFPIPVVYISPGSTTTYKMRAQAGAAGTVLQFAEASVIGTTMWAIKVA